MRAGDGPPTEVNFDPEHYNKVSTYDLLDAAARGLIGIDHRFLHAIVDHRDKAMPDLVRFAAENHEEHPVNLEEDLIAIFRYFTAPEAVPFYLKLIRIEVFHFERCAKGLYLRKSEDIWVMLIIGWPDLPVWEKFLGFLL